MTVSHKMSLHELSLNITLFSILLEPIDTKNVKKWLKVANHHKYEFYSLCKPQFITWWAISNYYRVKVMIDLKCLKFLNRKTVVSHKFHLKWDKNENPCLNLSTKSKPQFITLGSYFWSPRMLCWKCYVSRPVFHEIEQKTHEW